jgi:hypothetical protein
MCKANRSFRQQPLFSTPTLPPLFFLLDISFCHSRIHVLGGLEEPWRFLPRRGIQSKSYVCQSQFAGLSDTDGVQVYTERYSMDDAVRVAHSNTHLNSGFEQQLAFGRSRLLSGATSDRASTRSPNQRSRYFAWKGARGNQRGRLVIASGDPRENCWKIRR